MKYTPDEGEIRIRWWADEQGAHLSVQDTGIGVDPKHLPRLTERFYRVDSSRASNTGGTGLGLAIVKHVLIRHRARLEISSVPGKGSTFTCHFAPAQVAEAERKGAEVNLVAVPRHRRRHGQGLQATTQPLILKGLLATAHPHGPFS